MIQSSLAIEAYNQLWTFPFMKYFWMVIIIITSIFGIYMARKFVAMF